jgi:hypothetical protein
MIRCQRLLLASLALAMTASALAAAPAGSGAAKAPNQVIFSFAPSAKKTEIVFGNRNGRAPASRGSSAAEEELTPEIRRWGRLAGGAYLSLSNYSVLKSHYHVSQDKVLFGHASQMGFGLGASLDALYPGSGGTEGLRLRGGFSKFSIKPDDLVKKNFSPAQIESSATALDLTGLYRVVPGWDLGCGVFWAGGGLQLTHVFTTKRPGTGGAKATHLANSYGISGVLALGTDMEVSDDSDLGVELDWKPLAGFAVGLTWRSSL